MGLHRYRKMRDFGSTPEPAGRTGRKDEDTRAPTFVIQKHAATRLHYDFRLELDGTLKSWAVPKGPSMDPADRRLAVQVEDHPLEYASFEGTIPEHAYGGGHVVVWDRGTWEPLVDPHEGYAKGHLKFRLHGEKLAGGWALVRMQGRGAPGKENWLLVKERDEAARPGEGTSVVDARPESVMTGRTLDDVATGREAPARGRTSPARSRTQAPEPAAATRRARAAQRTSVSAKRGTGAAAKRAADTEAKRAAGDAAEGTTQGVTRRTSAAKRTTATKAANARATKATTSGTTKATTSGTTPTAARAKRTAGTTGSTSATARTHTGAAQTTRPAVTPVVASSGPKAANARRRAAAGARTSVRRHVPVALEASHLQGGTEREPGRRGTPRSRASSAVRKAAARDDTVAGIVITHPERVLYPDAEITKLDVARYYARMHPWLAPFLRDRPLSVVRCPQGPASTCFFQKHATSREIPAIDSVLIEESGGRKPYVLARTQAALAGLAQMGTIELHGWNARSDDVERADTLVLDLDPDPSVPFAGVTAAARECRALLTSLGLASFPKTTGGKGLHVVVPLARRVPWETAKRFARAIAELLVTRSPERYVASAAKDKRHGRIFVDYLRNARGATAVLPYSLRARAGATVATPLDWSEVGPGLAPEEFTLRTIEDRLHDGGDPWRGYATTRQTITLEMQRQLVRALAGRG